MLLCALLLPLTAACTGNDTTQDTSQDANQDTAGDAVEDTAQPEPEDTAATEEADTSSTDPVAVELPGLPIGGNSVVVSDTLQCADVGFTNLADVPDWLAVTVTGVELDPSDQFALTDEPCEGDSPSCLDGEARLSATQRCYVAVTWTGTSQDQGLLSFTSGSIACPPDQVDECESFKAQVEQVGPQPIGLEPAPAPSEGDDGGG